MYWRESFCKIKDHFVGQIIEHKDENKVAKKEGVEKYLPLKHNWQTIVDFLALKHFYRKKFEEGRYLKEIYQFIKNQGYPQNILLMLEELQVSRRYHYSGI